MKSADIGLLRFMRARTDEAGVLNEPDPARPYLTAGPGLPARLTVVAHRLRTVAVSDDGLAVAYEKVAAHPAYAQYRAVARELNAFDPWGLPNRDARLAFWINVYNALSIEAVLAFGLRKSIREVPGFFRRAAYCIGGRRFSSELIEHGILRGNQPPLPQLDRPIEPGNALAELCIEPPDPRIHFALNCAARSCPPLRVYSASTIEQDLDSAAAAFVRSGGVIIENGQVKVSAILLYYADDFGGAPGVASWLCRYLETATEQRSVLDAFARGLEVYEPYDWALNRVAPSAEIRV